MFASTAPAPSSETLMSETAEPMPLPLPAPPTALTVKLLERSLRSVRGITRQRVYAGFIGSAFIRRMLGWEPATPLDKGLAVTFAWIGDQYRARKAGQRVGIG